METLKGIITKGIGGFYYVRTSRGLIECRARGIFRKNRFVPLVGDEAEVEISREDSSKGVVAKICERKNHLIRPAVANVSQMVAVSALENPKPNTYILDKLIASAEFIGLKIVICFNKSDLSGDSSIAEIYQKAGFEVLVVSASERCGTENLKRVLENEVTVFAGNSGVGKSSLLNCVMESEMFETGEVSGRVERGRHTTRHSELVELPFGGFIIDTPGFSSFDINTIPLASLASMFREFGEYTDSCRFPDCGHTAEPDCGVIDAVARGEIAKSRHESYKLLYNEIKSAKQW